MTPEELNEKLINLIEHCKSLTLNLVQLSKDRKQIIDGASGFLIKVEDAIYLISAGHALKKSGWVIETSFVLENECLTACIPLGVSWTVEKLSLGKPETESVDVGWAKIDMNAFEHSILEDFRMRGKRFDYMLYQGPVEDCPDSNDPHIYASMNRTRMISALGKTGLEREISYEYEMEFKGKRSDGLYVFSIPKHKGHKYYAGASGSPIVEPTGKVLAILVAGCESKNELYGFPLPGVVGMIRVAIEVEHHSKPSTASSTDS